MLGLSEFKFGRYSDSLKHLQQGRQLGITNNPSLWYVDLPSGLRLLEKTNYECA